MIEHGIVYKSPDMFAGWPANHGAWQWGNEFLVGFMVGQFMDYPDNGHHRIAEPYTRMLARSLDGGVTWESWSVLDADGSGEAVKIPGKLVMGKDGKIAWESDPVFVGDGFEGLVVEAHDYIPVPGDIYRVVGCYDTGGDYTLPDGGFYASSDRGRTWRGMFRFQGIEYVFNNLGINTSRTCVLGNEWFLSVGDADCWGRDFVMTVRMDDSGVFGGARAINAGPARAVMPSATVLDGTTYCALRRRETFGKYWIDLYARGPESDQFEFVTCITSLCSNNGNPPALKAVGDTLVCCWGDRDSHSIRAATSEDHGQTWSYKTLREGGKQDIGYPQLFVRADGSLVVVYYWADKGSEEPQHIAYTRFGLD